jgi:hypothetical protein
MSLVQAFGDVQGLYTECKQGCGLVVVAYYDLRAAMSAQATLNGTLIGKQPISVGFAAQQARARDGRASAGQVRKAGLPTVSSSSSIIIIFTRPAQAGLWAA